MKIKTNTQSTEVLTIIEVFKKIRELKELRKANEVSLHQETTAFIEKIKNQQGSEIVEHLQKIIGDTSNIQTASLQNDALDLPENLKLKAQNYKKYFNASTYLDLLPYMQLAYTFEKNGSPEEHAFKLAVLFKTSEEALSYLYKHIQGGVYENCLFVLPNSEHCNFTLWQKLAKKHSGSDKDPFIKLLGQASEIEEIINQIKEDESIVIDHNKYPFLKNESKEKWQALSKAINEIEKKHAKWKKARKNHEHGNEEYIELSQELWADKINLLKLYSIEYLFNENTPLSILCWFQEQLSRYQNESYKAMLSHGLTTKDYEKFKNLDRKNAGKNIPDLTIDGNDLGYPGYYLRKINVQDEKEAVLATFLGKLTSCCQSLSGEAGEPCAIHGLTNIDGGFYIVVKGDVNGPKALQDEVIAQSWTWRSKMKALVFDSVEIKSNSSDEEEEMAISFYRNLAKKLVLENYTHKVNCGSKSGISAYIGFQRTLLSEEFSDDYQDYTDSRTQHCVFDKDKQFYLYQDGGPQIRSHIEAKIISVMQKKVPYVYDVDFCEMLNWALIHLDSSKELLDKIKETARDYGREAELSDFLEKMEYFLKQKASNLNFQDLLSWIDQNNFYINTEDSKGKTLLIHALETNQQDVTQELIKRGIDCRYKDAKGNTVLFYAVDKPRMFRTILDAVSEKEILLNQKDDSGVTVFHALVYLTNLFIPLFEILNPAEQSLVLNEKNLFDTTLFKKIIAADYEVIIKVFESLPYEKSLEFLRETQNTHGLISCNSEAFIDILKFFPEEERIALLKMIAIGSNDFLCEDIYNKPKKLIKILERYIPESQRLSFLKAKNNLNETIFYKALSNDSSAFYEIINLVPEEDRISLLTETEKHCPSIWDFDLANPERLVALLPTSEKLTLFKEENNAGKGLDMLFRLSYHPEKIAAFLKEFSTEEKLALLKEEKYWREDDAYLNDLLGKRTLLHEISYLQRSFIPVLELFNEEERLSLFKGEDSTKKAKLCSNIIFCPQTVIAVLKLFSKENRLKVIKEIYSDPKNNLSDLIAALSLDSSLDINLESNKEDLAVEISEKNRMLIYCMLLREVNLNKNVSNKFFEQTSSQINKNMGELLAIFEGGCSETTLQSEIRMFLERNNNSTKNLCKNIAERLPEQHMTKNIKV